MQLKRSFLTLQQGMLDEELLDLDHEEAMRTLFHRLASLDRDKFHAGALALERAPKTGTIHVQGYLEHKRMRPKTIAKHLHCRLANGVMIVKNAKASWDYCAGLGVHATKPALARLTWGEPLLHGSQDETKLRDLVNAIVDGAELDDLMKTNPYGWCVHRERLVKFHSDWNFGIQ